MLLQLNKSIEFDAQKRLQTLKERGLDSARATEVFASVAANIEDKRLLYGEQRFISFGFIDYRLVAEVWTVRGTKRRIISMRKANEREIKKYA